MNKDLIKAYVEANSNLVSMRESIAYPGLFVLKYKKRVFFDGLWNDFLEECRGTIVDQEFNVVSRPFTKIYNYGVEDKAPKLPDTLIVDAYRKINGFMVAVTLYKDELLVSTTGSTDSDFVGYAKELIDMDLYRQVCEDYPGHTFMFECVHEKDPHIIPELPGMYLLGYRANDWDSPIDIDPTMLSKLSNEFNTLPVAHTRLSLGTLLKAVKLVKHEGFVFYTDDGRSAKIKSPYYLVNKFVARNPRTDKLMRKDVKQSLDEEYYNLIDHIQSDIESFTSLNEQERLVFVRDFLSQ